MDNSFVVHITEYNNIIFSSNSSGLYYFDVSRVDVTKLKETFNFLTGNTAFSNKSMYGKRELGKADEARMNHTTKDKFERIIKDNWIRMFYLHLET